MMRRLLHKNDSGISEVIGFVLSFAISSIFLMLAMSSFYTAKNNSDSVITATELTAIADRIAAAVIEAGLVGQEFPNASMNISLTLPQQLNGHDYHVDAHNYGILVNSTDGAFTANATTFKLDAIAQYAVYGSAYSSNEHLTVSYFINATGTPTAGTPNIMITGV
ncbi:MAG: hypothetical protein WDA16_14785 [Candidatus Thermoplasmatota archaeon]